MADRDLLFEAAVAIDVTQAEIERLRPAAESWESYVAAQERKGEPVETTGKPIGAQRFLSNDANMVMCVRAEDYEALRVRFERACARISALESASEEPSAPTETTDKAVAIPNEVVKTIPAMCAIAKDDPTEMWLSVGLLCDAVLARRRAETVGLVQLRVSLHGAFDDMRLALAHNSLQPIKEGIDKVRAALENSPEETKAPPPLCDCDPDFGCKEYDPKIFRCCQQEMEQRAEKAKR